MKLIFIMDGTMAMHFAPDMMLSGIPRSGASIIWLRMVVALCTRSMSALRAPDWAHMAVESNTSRAMQIFFINSTPILIRGASGQSTPAVAILFRFDADLAELKWVGRLLSSVVRGGKREWRKLCDGAIG